MTGPCLPRERPVLISKKALRIQNALFMGEAREDFRFEIPNRSDMPVNLPEGYAVGILEPTEVPLKERPQGGEEPPGEGADRVAVVGRATATFGDTKASPTV